MAMLWEKIVVTAKEFLTDYNINDCKEINEPIFKVKLKQFGWEPNFSASSVFCEIVWKISIGRESLTENNRLDRLFSPSAIATHANFRGCQDYKTGSLPQKGAIVIWRRGNSWQGHMAIVSEVSEDKQSFDVIEGRVLVGDAGYFIQTTEVKDKKMGLPFKSDKLNLLGFIYPPNREIA